MSNVISKDGTKIAYEQKGAGPALILIDGALTYRSFGAMRQLADLLAPHFSVFTYDRRGRGESGDSKPYAVEREVEDLDALIQIAGGSAGLYGMSSGACLALEAAVRLGNKVKKIAMYEAPYNSMEPARRNFEAYQKNLNQVLAAGKPGDAVLLFFQLVGRPADEVEKFRNSPSWPMLEAVAPSLAYDAAVMGKDGDVPVKMAARLNTPALLMNGSASSVHTAFMGETAAALAKAMPLGKHRMVEGQGHDVNLEVLAPVLTEFFSS